MASSHAKAASEASSDSEDDVGLAMMVSKTRSRRAGVSAEPTHRSIDWKPPVYEKTPQECQHLCEIIKNSTDSKLKMMFGSVAPETFHKIIEAMFVKEVAEGEHVIEEGEVGDFFYIVKSGHFDLFQTNADPGIENGTHMVKVFEAAAGFSFGELGLLYNSLRSATVVATARSEVWCLERTPFQMLVVRSSEERFNQYVEFLRKCEIFSEVSDAEIANLAEVFHEEDFDEDESILEQGDRDDNMYILIKGEAVACIKGGKGEVEVKKYSPGDYFGEIALLLGEPRKASVYAVGPAKCLCVSHDTFNVVLGPLRDFLERNMSKYEEYQDAIVQAPSQERRHSRDAFQERRLSGEFKPVEGLVLLEENEVFDGTASNEKRARKLRDRSLIVRSDTEADLNTQRKASKNMSLSDRIAQDFENTVLARPDDRFLVKDATLQVFGSWRLGEKFTHDKVAFARTKVPAAAAQGEELRWEDTYTWSAPSWLQGSTHAAVLCQKGCKDADPTPNQDNYFIVHVGPLQIYGVCDGHGPFGHLVSFRLVQTLPHFLTTSPYFGKDWPRAMKEAFLSAQRELIEVCREQNVNIEASGAAGTMLVFEGPRIHIAHIGDSSAMVASWNRHDSRLVHGTNDHKPQLPGEKERLEQAGMEVRQVDPDDENSCRIYLPGLKYPGLTMSRCFGDTVCSGLSQEPEYKEILLQPSDEYYAVIASDGIWEFITLENGADLSSKKLRLKGPRETVNFLTSASRKRWQACCGSYCDDITCIVVKWNIAEKGSTNNHLLTVKRAE
mmetsp:Transcript_128326/g.411251  ORF Transcript_128326/g.411251 Transcript_128326/m.411251 type:complete len:783 (+) Transcript_128326:350-2698(+)|eukprot:CAMPEP_0203933882 /NCGR_PEP_ID=MMETSP0359-20131031/71976_1 /ASSEMBLY_ACC=CAM_ASM_000338 /TAXON_ID=268821 /ORGANISM="Scrippsiella Hangoei, Strain SHTV-5" /LENGTH=782 /DNA_ID=CAMNT_0050863523 /DNA_START=306 /DNA_END=2654 /DNA_ORIENTATION=+